MSFLALSGPVICCVGVVLSVLGHEKQSNVVTVVGATVTGFTILWWQFSLMSVAAAGICFLLALLVLISSWFRTRSRRWP